MPEWLIAVLTSVLNYVGPLILSVALKFIESKNPGLSPVIKDILDYVDGHPEPQIAIKNIKDGVAAVATIPDTVDKV